MEEKKTRYGIAYASFVVLALISCWTCYLTYSVLRASGGASDGLAPAIGFFVLIPFGIPLLVALILGPGMTILFFRRDPYLTTMTGLSILLVVTLNISDNDPWYWLKFNCVYGIACIIIIGIKLLLRFKTPG